MSFLSKLWLFIRRPTGYVGRDLEGNLFYEYPGEWRSRRVVRFQGRKDMLELATGQQQLSVQWRAWLSHTRTRPPTLEELQADVMRQMQLQRKVAVIEERDRQERQRLAIRNSNPLEKSNTLQAPTSEESSTSSKSDETIAPSHGRGSVEHSTFAQNHHSSNAPHDAAQRSPPSPTPEALETQSWTPVAARRRR